jgi:hypothetical protein
VTSTLLRLVRPAAAAAAVLLVVGAVRAAPAAAAPVDAPPVTALSLTSRAGYSPVEDDGGPGYSPGSPALVGDAPAFLSLVVHVTNTGTEPLHDIVVAARVVTNGTLYDLRCRTVLLPRDVTQSEPRRGEPMRGKAAKGALQPPSSQRLDTGPWTNPALVLMPGQTLYCSVTVSDIMARLHEDVTSATAVGVDTGTAVSDDAHVWALADPAPPPQSWEITIGDVVWLDTDRDQTPDEGEPGIAGVRLSVKGPDGLPPTDWETGQPAGPQTTDENGVYHFRHLQPYGDYTVTLDLASPPLADLTATLHAGAGWSPESSTWSMLPPRRGDDSHEVNFGFVPKDPLVVTVDAPTTAVAGKTITVAGLADRPDVGRWDGPTVLEFRAGGTTAWTKVADARNDGGVLSASVTATRSGSFRYRTPGDYYTSSAVSREDHVLVRTAPVTLTAAAPASVRDGASLTVTGTIPRAGTAFQTGRTILEYSPEATTWTKTADVRSTTDGGLSAKVQPARTGSYRYRYLGDSKTAPGTSPARHVVVLEAAVTR